MFHFIYKKLTGKVLASVGTLALLCGSIGAPFHQAVKTKQPQTIQVSGWKRFHSVPGSCSISLPSSPEHVKQIMPLTDQGHDLRYDVYVSALERKAVYMLLVAQYPPFFASAESDASLESFLNGLVTQNPENKLIFADLTEVNGHKALDFYIQAKGTNFKGRAIMANNNLYLLAMECDTKNYCEEHFKHFIESFQFHLN